MYMSHDTTLLVRLKMKNRINTFFATKTIKFPRGNLMLPRRPRQTQQFSRFLCWTTPKLTGHRSLDHSEIVILHPRQGPQLPRGPAQAV